MIEKKDMVWVVTGMFFFLLLGIFARAAEAPLLVEKAIQDELRKAYPVARIELIGAIKWSAIPHVGEVKRIRILADDHRGWVRFNINEEAEGSINFSAWVPARVALRRVYPGEQLSADKFVVQDVNVASGMAHEYRGVILQNDLEVSRLEARQTILEGQFALSTGVQRIPDVKRGEPLRIRLLSGELTLSTTGTAEEPAYIGNTVRVLTTKGKRQLAGKLCENGVVEVKL